MNFWEKYGTLVAVSLCGVSLIPSASMVNAQEEPEANQDKKAPETRKDTAISWKEVQRAPYYKDEEVSPQTETFGPEKPAEKVQAAAAVQTEEAEAPAVQEAAETAYAEETAQPYVPEQTAVFASDYAVPEVQPVYAEEQPAYIYEETAV
ncbi:MAG: hypothetical protein HUJ54_15340, partial [Erysipelotrichaceae bacterium]|nr:hypothetical protein [Erysipelotrichaceae bacterium]